MKDHFLGKQKGSGGEAGGPRFFVPVGIKHGEQGMIIFAWDGGLTIYLHRAGSYEVSARSQALLLLMSRVLT